MYKIKPMQGKKALAWRWFAKYIKLRDAINTTGTKERAMCVTCGEEYDIEYMDAGHMIPGRTGGILFDEEIVYAQCRPCNRQGAGEKQAYKMIMVKMHGIEWYEQKERNRRKVTKTSESGYQLIADRFRERYNELKNS